MSRWLIIAFALVVGYVIAKSGVTSKVGLPF